jgi:betaine reductase
VSIWGAKIWRNLMKVIRVIHYMNQFFAGIGGEERADVPPESRAGPVGPGIGLQAELGDGGRVVASVFCGDNLMVSDSAPTVIDEIVELIRDYEPDVVVAGPSFGSGRYGLACGQVCVAAQERLGVPVVAAMSHDSPGAEQFRSEIFIVPTGATVASMRKALFDLARIALRLGEGAPIGSPQDEGYLPKGYRRNEFADRIGATRAVEMLLRKIKDKSFTTEWPLPVYDRVIAPPALPQRHGIRIALVTEGGVVPKGNPDRLPAGWASKWAKYDVSDVIDLTSESYETVHGGFDTMAANEDPDRLIPVDTLQELSQEGELTLHNYLYSTVGNMGSITEMRRLGSEIAIELQQAGVDAVIVGST